MLDETYNHGVEDAATMVDALAKQMGSRGNPQAAPMIAALQHVAKEVRGLKVDINPALTLPELRAARFDVRAGHVG